MELAGIQDLKRTSEGHAGSSPATSKNFATQPRHGEGFIQNQTDPVRSCGADSLKLTSLRESGKEHHDMNRYLSRSKKCILPGC